jgi:hypothetical protein
MYRPWFETLEDRTVPTNLFWIGPAGGAWSVPANWVDAFGVNRLPSSQDQLQFDAGTGASVINGDFHVSAVFAATGYSGFTFLPGVTVNADDAFWFGGTSIITGGTSALPTTLHSGDIELLTDSSTTITGVGSFISLAGALGQNGPVKVNAGATLLFSPSTNTTFAGDILQYGHMTIQGSNPLTPIPTTITSTGSMLLNFGSVTDITPPITGPFMVVPPPNLVNLDVNTVLVNTGGTLNLWPGTVTTVLAPTTGDFVVAGVMTMGVMPTPFGPVFGPASLTLPSSANIFSTLANSTLNLADASTLICNATTGIDLSGMTNVLAGGAPTVTTPNLLTLGGPVSIGLGGVLGLVGAVSVTGAATLTVPGRGSWIAVTGSVSGDFFSITYTSGMPVGPSGWVLIAPGVFAYVTN